MDAAPSITPDLSPEVQEIITATVPILTEHGAAITARFYELLFERHPDVRSMFADPVDTQATRLAQAVLAYAQNISSPEVLLPVIERIGRRHVAAGVEDGQYPIVGDTLLAAMVDVLGELDLAVVEAWAAAYQWLADRFIEVEAGLRADALVVE